MVKRSGILCPTCRDKILLEKGEKRQADKDKQQAAWKKKHEEIWKVKRVEICPKSPENKGHYEIIDTSTNIGKCKYCGKIKDYNELQKDIVKDARERG